eukprot:375785-Rhodomonas_salina.2
MLIVPSRNSFPPGCHPRQARGSAGLHHGPSGQEQRMACDGVNGFAGQSQSEHQVQKRKR